MTPAHCARLAMMSHTEDGLQPAWLLHRRPFRNTSLIVELFVPRLGRIGAVVRGGARILRWRPFVPYWSNSSRPGSYIPCGVVSLQALPFSWKGKPCIVVFISMNY